MYFNLSFPIVDLTLTIHLTIPFCFLIFRKYVNLLTWLWLCLWPFCLAFSFLACMWTCWFDSDHASDHPSCFLISSLYVNLLIWLWPCLWSSLLLSYFQLVCELVALALTAPLTVHLTFSFPGTTWTCMYLDICCCHHQFLINFSGYVFKSQLS